MKEYLSKELLDTINHNNQEVHAILKTIASSTFSPEKSLHEVQLALDEQQALYDENLALMGMDKMNDLDTLLSVDLGVAATDTKGSDMFLDILNAKRTQIQELTVVRDYFKTIASSMENMEASLLEISQAFNKMLV